MKIANLLQYKHGTSNIDGNVLTVARANPLDTLQQASLPIGQKKTNSKAEQMLGVRFLDLVRDAGGGGLWVPYLPRVTVYDYLQAGQTWAASGPFSGCYFEVGKHNGQIYVAHVSCESAQDENVQRWMESAGASKADLPGKQKLFSKKIRLSSALPEGAMHAAAVVFAQVAGDNVTCFRVDVQGKNAGDMRGPIFDVQQIASD